MIRTAYLTSQDIKCDSTETRGRANKTLIDNLTNKNFIVKEPDKQETVNIDSLGIDYDNYVYTDLLGDTNSFEYLRSLEERKHVSLVCYSRGKTQRWEDKPLHHQ